MAADLDVLASAAIGEALRLGADDADSLGVESQQFSVGVRLDRVESLNRSRERRLSLRVFRGGAVGAVSTSDLGAGTAGDLARQALEIAEATAPDPAAGLPYVDDAPVPEDLDIFDPAAETVDADEGIERARTAERAARAVDSRIENSEGSEFSAQSARITYASSSNRAGTYEHSVFSVHAIPVAVSDRELQRDWDFDATRHLSRLEASAIVGQRAGERALARLGSRPIATQEIPVVLDARVAGSIVGHVAEAACGTAIYRGESFLADKLGSMIGSPTLRLVDDPLRRGALGARPFDGEGLASRRVDVVRDGVLREFLLDAYSARKLGRRPTASAVRSAERPPTSGPSRFVLEPGDPTPDEIVSSVDRGLFVTELFGHGVNPVTGDFSRGASGRLIEAGRLSSPVHEVTIAGNLFDLLAGIEMIGSDLDERRAIAAPTIKIRRLTVAGPD